MKHCRECMKDFGELQLFRGSDGRQYCTNCFQRREYSRGGRMVVPANEWK